MSSTLLTETKSMNEGGPSPSPTVIEVRNLTKKFTKGTEGPAAVENVSFAVAREVVGLFGPSGCGKTTTLRCIAGLERPDSGEILIDGKVVTSPQKGIFVSPERRNIGLVFQSYALWPHMKVFDNVSYALRVRHFSKSEIKERVLKALDMVGLTGYEERYPSQLSGGQQQRVALARSLVYEPKVLLLDEPLSNLDAKIRERTRVELKNLLTRIGISSVYVTHDQEEAFVLADRILVMNEGKIVQAGTPYTIYQRPANEFVASFIGRSNMVEGVVVSKKSEQQGVVRILGKYEITCELPNSLSVGEDCSVIIRSNEVGILDEKPKEGNVIPCKIQQREYKGAVTDHLVLVGERPLIVTTHRFCQLDHISPFGDVEKEDVEGRQAFLEIRKEAVTVVPKGSQSTKAA